MIKYIYHIVIILFVFLFSQACKDYTDSEKYQRPAGLEGKLLEQLQTLDDNRIFVEAIQKAELEDLFNSGFFTVFSPTDKAFEDYFTAHGTALDQISKSELEKLIRFHVIQGGWREDQLTGMTSSGWVDTLAVTNNVPIANKRQTIFRAENYEVFIQKKGLDEYVVLDSTSSTRKITIVPDDRKYMPLYYDDFFSGNNLSFSDYNTFYNRNYEPGEIFYGNGKVISNSIPAENGFIYQIDKVIEPIYSVEEMLRNAPDGMYNDYLAWLYEFSHIAVNKKATANQQASSTGGVLNDLYDLTFDIVSINKEVMLTRNASHDLNMSQHLTQIAPTNAAFDKFYLEYFTGQNGRRDFNSIPKEMKSIIIQEHLSFDFVYQSAIEKGFFNFNKYLVENLNDHIIEKSYGSNGNLIGVNEPLIPRILNNTIAPVVLLEDYSTFFYGMSKSGTFDMMTSKNNDYDFFILKDDFLAEDSTLEVSWVDVNQNIYYLQRYNERRSIVRYADYDLKRKILNQIVVEKPFGGRRKEFLRNALGNYVAYSDYNGTNPASVSTTSTTEIHIEREDRVPVDNGKVYFADNWFPVNMTSAYVAMGDGSKFVNLLLRVKILDPANKLMNRSVISAGEYYTVFVPTDVAVDESGIAALPDDELKQILLNHFVKGSIIFTDARLPSDNYFTYAKADKDFTYKTLKIITSPDKIIIDDGNGSLVEINEDDNKTNRLIAYDTYTNIEGDRTDLDSDWIITGVAHIGIDHVLLP